MGACCGHSRRHRWPAASRARNAACTSGWSGFARLPSRGNRCEIVVAGGDERLVSHHFPRIQRVAPLLKRWLLGTHQGAVKPRYPDRCSDEFTFRFNRGTSWWRGTLFRCLRERAVAVEPVPRAQLSAAARAKASGRPRSTVLAGGTAAFDKALGERAGARVPEPGELLESFATTILQRGTGERNGHRVGPAPGCQRSEA